MARNPTRRNQRDADIRKDYKALIDKNKIERKYRTEYLLEQVATKYYLTPRTVYAIIRGNEAEPNPNQLDLFVAGQVN